MTTQSSSITLGCDYSHPGTTLACRGDGYLWDADHDGYDPSEQDHSCPQCNTLEYLERAKDEAESTIDGSTYAGAYTGESLWCGAVAVAQAANPKATRDALTKIARVAALRPSAAGDSADWEEVIFEY